MRCASCNHENRDGAKFCEECAVPLKRLCGSCGLELRPAAKFCDECGTSVTARPVEAAGARKVVTIVFADLIGSTSLHERLDAESTRRLMDRYYGALRGAVEVHGGTVVKLMGDGVMAAFGVPRVAEDDAIRAVRAGVAMQQAFRTLADEQAAAVGQLGLRVGINTGEVIVSADNTDVVGDPVNVAARLQQEAQDGDVLLGESTRRLVSELATLAPFGVLSLKGRAETVAAYRVVSLERPAGAAATAFVGRDDELRRVMAVYAAAGAERRARLAVVLGSPGLGKSRLLEEVARRLGDNATVLSAHCEQAGGATFAPIAKAVRALLGAENATSGLPQLGHAAAPAAAQGGALGSGLAAPSGLSGGHRVETHQPQRGDQPIARGNAPGGDGVAELRTMITSAIPGADAERTRIADGITALLAGTPGSPEETFFVVRRFLAALAATRPVVLAIDDLQWAEPLLLDLIEHLIQWSKDVPLLVLAAARPELRDTRSALAAVGGLVTDVVMLAGLDAGAATRLAANVIGAGELPAAVAGRVLATSEGNPLFLSELVRMLVNDGALKQEGDRWAVAVDLATLDMPPTIHALLAARIERLGAEDRAVLERAAVVGRQFSRSAVAHLLPREVTDLDARLETLRRSELIEPDASWFLGEPALRFHHGLTRDAAYRRVLKETRAELHARLAEWIETKVGDAIEHDETLGWHLEQAHQHLRELGPIDARGRELGARAARYLAAAGRRALARDDVSPAANLLGRALDRLDAADPARAELALDWCEALLAAGDVGHAKAAIDELGRFTLRQAQGERGRVMEPGEGSAHAELVEARGGGLEQSVSGGVRLRAWHTCFTGQLAVLTDPQSLHATTGAVAAAADALAAVGDSAGEAKAHLVHAQALSRLGKIGACEAALDKALAAARHAHDRRRSNTVLANAPLAALWGPSPVTRASGRCLDVVRVLRITQGAPAVEAVALRCQAVLEALRGRTDAARRMIASARRMVEELGITQQLLEADVFTGLIDLLEGDAIAAERSLRAAYDGLRAHGLGIDAARAAAFLGRALLQQDRAAEAEALSHESEALAGDDLQATITWRGVRAEALARRGEQSAAIDFARAAVDIAGATDVLLLHADARLVLATTLRAAGRGDEADVEERRAIELWEAKGAVLLVERARESASARHAGNLPAGIQEGGVDSRLVTAGMTDETPMSPLGKRRTNEGLLPTVQPARRRVRPNAATASAASFEVAIAARDADAIAAHIADGQNVEHQTGAVYDRQAQLATWLSLLRAKDGRYRTETLASLGDSLALCHQWASASALASATLDVGAYEIENVLLIEVNAQGQRRWTEVFATDRLGDAVARLYERYAELLPDGSERDRAAATARSVASLLGSLDVDRWAAAIARGVEFVDRRTIGIGSTRGAEAFLRGLGSLLEVADDVATRVDDILSLRPDTLLMHWTNFGTDRVGGGAFERRFLWIGVFGSDGLLTRLEHFDSDRDAEALARFDQLTGEAQEPLPRPLSETERGAHLPPSLAGKGARGLGSARRVRANAATANAARRDAAFAARDIDAIDALAADGIAGVHHPTGAPYDHAQGLELCRLVLQAQDLRHRFEPLATLGDSLALGRMFVSGSGTVGEKLDVGSYEVEEIQLLEVDVRGRLLRFELFANNHLGDAVARLYQRYAEILPDGPERVRAAATARSVATLLGPVDLDRYATAFAPAIEFTDGRTVGVGSVHGAEALMRAIRVMLDLAEHLTTHLDDILDLRADALLVRWTTFGTDRASGGPFERNLCPLWIFGPDGLVARWDQFDAEHGDEALARFDELTASTSVSPLTKGRTKEGSPARSARRVQPNAATAHAARLDAVIAARDADALRTLFSEQTKTVDHTMGAVIDRAGILTTWRRAFGRAQDLSYGHEPLATLGNSLALCRRSRSGSGVAGRMYDVGAWESETVVLIEVDAAGRRQRLDNFAADRLGDAIARLYERYAELLPDGPERERAAATARSVATLLESFEPDRWATAFSPAIEACDPRTVGMGSVHGADALLPGVRAMFDLTADWTTRVDEILDLRSDALLVRWTNFGIDRASGGVFERNLCILWTFGADGLLTRWEQSDTDRDAEALARFDELTASNPSVSPLAKGRTNEGSSRPVRRVRLNAATAHAAREDTAFAARDSDAFAALFADDMEVVDHPNGATHDLLEYLASMRLLLKTQGLTRRHEPLATLGDALALCRLSLSSGGIARGNFDVGAYEVEEVILFEVDAQGRCRRAEFFADNRLGDAITRLYERYADLRPAGPARDRAAVTARSAKTLLESFEPDRWATAFSPAIEFCDPRTVGMGSVHGADALLPGVRALFDLTTDWTTRVDEILDLRSDALLVRWTNFGTDRASGGAFERNLCILWIFGADGLLRRWEQSEADRHNEALVRFDELTGNVRHAGSLQAGIQEGGVDSRQTITGMTERVQPAHRRVRANAAIANAHGVEAAVAARDANAFATFLAEDAVTVDHLNGAEFDRADTLRLWRTFLSAEHFTFAVEPLATLGESLALLRDSASASGVTRGKFDVGPYERDRIDLVEVDPRGRRRRSEHFAADRLGDAVVRLYERYAETLPDGFERSRIAATARSLAGQLGALDLDHLVAAMAPTVEFLDQRIIVGVGSAHGVQAFRDALRTLFEAADDMANRVDDVLDLRADALLLRITNFGTERAGGGTYERPFLMAYVFGADGLVTRLDQFDIGHEAEALARFDELVGGGSLPLAKPVLSGAEGGGQERFGSSEQIPLNPPSSKGEARSSRRVRANAATVNSARLDAAVVARGRVRPNAATAHAGRLDAAIAARDADALPTLFSNDMEAMDHITHTTWDLQAVRSSWRSLALAEDPTCRHEPFATLGDSLALCRMSLSASRLARGNFDVGAYEKTEIHLIEVDAQGRRCWTDVFAVEKLGDAVVRLYERSAELLPDGPERTRAAATARSVGKMVGPFDLDRYATVLARGIESVDRRTLGTWSAHGAEALLQHCRALLDLADGVAMREDDILDLRSDALLVRRTHLGTDHASGGTYERQFLLLSVFGPDGLVTRNEMFDADRDDAALARFDELVASSLEGLRIEAPVVRFENAATRFVERFTDAWTGRDWERVAASYRRGFQRIDRRAMVQLQLDRDQHVEFMRPLFEMSTSRLEASPLASRGNRLALARFRFDGADRWTGPTVIEHLVLTEVDDHGEAVAHVVFDADDLDAAYAELDARYAAGEAAAHPRASAWVAVYRRAFAKRDWEALAALHAPDQVAHNHRMVGWGTLSGPGAWVPPLKALVELAPDARLRLDHLRTSGRGILWESTWQGTRDGGAFETPWIHVVELDELGRQTRLDVFDIDQLDQARARFEEIGAAVSDPLRIPPNAASRALDRTGAAFAACDWPALRSLTSHDFAYDDRRRRDLLSGDVELWIASLQFVASAHEVRFERELIGTVGERIAVERVLWTGGSAGSRFDSDQIRVSEIDADGQLRALIVFDLDDRRAAFAEAQARFVAGEAAAIGGQACIAMMAGAFARRDWEALRGGLADDFVFRDHRTLGLLGELRRDEWVESLRVQADLAPDVDVEALWIIAWHRHGRVDVGRLFGTIRDGGPFENVFLRVMVTDSDQLRHFELFDVGDADQALARFDELCAERG